MNGSSSLEVRTDFPSRVSADVLVVGGGLSGLQVARDLWANGAKVVVLEAGPVGELSHINKRASAEESLRTWLEASSSDPMFRAVWRTQAPPHYAGYSGLRQVVGGRSLYWHGVVLPIEHWALEDRSWPTALCRDLTTTWQAGRGLYEQVLAELSAWAGTQVRTGQNRLVAMLHAIGFTGARSKPYAVRRFDDTGRWAAYSPLDVLLTEAADSLLVARHGPPPTIFADCQATGLRVDRVTQIPELDVCSAGRQMRVSAPFVVLAAGAIENARLVAKFVGNSFEAPAARRFTLYDHIVQGFIARLPASLLSEPSDALSNSWGAMIPGDATKRSNLFVTAELQGDSWLLDAWEMGEQLPSAESWVEVFPDDQAPLVNPGLSNADLLLVKQQQGSLNQFWSRIAAAVGIEISDLSFAAFGGQGQTYAELVRGGLACVKGSTAHTYYCPLGTVDHEAGTLPYGSVLNDNGGLQNYDRIRVVGPASFPRMGAANPSLTTIALARRTAALIK